MRGAGMGRRAMLLGALGVAALSRGALAAYPDHPVRVVVPYAAGGNVDVVARLLAPRLGERLGQSLVVDNRAGAGGSIGAEAVAHARADGYTLLAGSNGPLTVNPVVQARLPYDPERELAPIGLTCRVPLVLMVTAGLAPRTLAEFLAYARARPGAVGVGSSGTGSATHLALEGLNAATGVTLQHVPYRGGGAVLPDLIAGNLPAVVTEFSTALPLHRDGQGRILAIASVARSPLAAEIPTFAEAGVPGFLAASYVGLLAPAGTPAEAVGAIGAALVATLGEAPVRARLLELGAEVATAEEMTPAGFTAFLRRELAGARAAAAAAGLHPE